MVYKWLQSIPEHLFPAYCMLCGDPGHQGLDLCAGCLADLPRLGQHCPLCALPLRQTAAQSLYCGGCQRHPPPFTHTHSLFRYGAPLDYLIQRLKFSGDLRVARLLGTLMAQQACAHTPHPDWLLPVPLHRSRLRERGFNQALELARPIARQAGISIAHGWVRRRQATRAQSRLDAKARSRNLRGAFEVCHCSPDAHIAIIDDVMTTGSTVRELAGELRKAGVGRIEIWVCARTP